MKVKRLKFESSKVDEMVDVAKLKQVEVEFKVKFPAIENENFRKKFLFCKSEVLDTMKQLETSDNLHNIASFTSEVVNKEK